MLLTLATAKMHLRVTHALEDELIELYLAAAEQSAFAALDRKVYPDAASRTAAIAAAPAAYFAAVVAHTAAIEAAELIEDCQQQAEAIRVADLVLQAARIEARQVHDGIVINAAINGAILLTLGHLYNNRENVATGLSVTALPHGADALLMPYRVLA